MEGSEGQLEGSEVHLSGSEGQPGGKGWMDGQTDIQANKISPHAIGLCPLSGPQAKKEEEIGEREVLYIHQLTTNVTSDIFELDSRSFAQMVAPKNNLSMVPISVILHKVLSLRSKGNTRKHATIESD